MRFPISFLVIVAVLLPGASAAAGVVLHVVETVDGQRRSHTEMDLSAEGDGLRGDYVASDSPFTPTGSYLLLPSEELIYIVNPAKKTYVAMDMAAMAGMLQATQRMQLQAGRGSGHNAPENVVVDKKVDEAGPAMLGLPTQHIVYEVSYHLPPPVPNAPVFDYHERYELWTTSALDARLASAPALKREGGRLADLGAVGGGGGEPKEVTAAIASHGFILKENHTKESKMTLGALTPMMGPATFMRSRQGQPTIISFAVTAIRDESVPAERFVLPQGYSEIEMMNPNMGAMPDLSQLPGRPGAAMPAGTPAPQPGAAPPGAPPPPPMPDLNNIPK
jgi:hypothetical protein